MATRTHTTRTDRAWLDAPFSQKDAAKAAGARWDPTAKRWYGPATPTAALQRWTPLPDVPDLLPGEDRGFGSGLFVDMVPRTCWFTNVHRCLSERDWERLRRMMLCRADHRCEACGTGEDRDRGGWLEAQERWSYDEHAGTQTLRCLICLCSPCHLATHIGYANVTGRADFALTHLLQVTGMTSDQAAAHVERAGQDWPTRFERPWRLDLRILTDAGVALCRPDTPEQRVRVADRTPSDRQTANAGRRAERPS